MLHVAAFSSTRTRFSPSFPTEAPENIRYVFLGHRGRRHGSMRVVQESYSSFRTRMNKLIDPIGCTAWTPALRERFFPWFSLRLRYDSPVVSCPPDGEEPPFCLSRENFLDVQPARMRRTCQDFTPTNSLCAVVPKKGPRVWMTSHSRLLPAEECLRRTGEMLLLARRGEMPLCTTPTPAARVTSICDTENKMKCGVTCLRRPSNSGPMHDPS